jgi:hypothetical protein
MLGGSHTPFTCGYALKTDVFLFARKPAALQVNNRVNETSEITVQVKITSQATSFITQILLFLAYAGSSFVKTLN